MVNLATLTKKDLITSDFLPKETVATKEDLQGERKRAYVGNNRPKNMLTLFK